MPKNIVVVGAGIVGAAIGYHLARQGARVTIVDAGEPGGLATRASWAWINASWGNPEFYVRLRLRSMKEWRRLAEEIPDLKPRWVGGLLWDLPMGKLEAFAREHASWGYGTRLVERAEAQRLEPHLAHPPELAVHVSEEGAIEPLEAAKALLTAAQSLSAEVKGHTHVKRLALAAGAVAGIETEAGPLAADHVVLAAGAGVPPLAATAGIAVPLTTPAGLLVHSKPVGPMLNGLVMAPELHLRQTPEGRLIAGSDFGGADPGAEPGETAHALFDKVKSFVKSGERLQMDFHTLGYRPTPRDEYPVIGPAPGVDRLYIAVMHSGITNAAAVGLLAAREILTGERDELLSPFGLERFE